LPRQPRLFEGLSAHLFKAGELLGQVLLSWHNVAYYQMLMARLRAAIVAGRLEDFRATFMARQSAD
jgi:queuine tRNA-ribosyltransferase